MKNKFWFLVRHSLKKKYKSKSFIISNILLFILLVGLLNIDKIISFFGGDFNEETNIYVVDNTNNSYDLFKENYNNIKINILNDDKTNIVKSSEDIDTLKDKIKDNLDIIVEINNDLENVMSVNVISENYIDNLVYQSIIQSINNTKYQLALMNSNIDIAELNKIGKTVSIERIILDESKNTEEENMKVIMDIVFPTLILPFFMLIILLVQMIGGEINEEKTTKSMEIIISNVSAKVHFFSKLVANNLFILSQSILLFCYGAVGFLLRNIIGGSSEVLGDFGEIISTFTHSGIVDKLYYVIPVTIVIMTLSFVAYSLIAGILASMTVNQEDFQHIQTPIMLICFLSYYLAIMSSMFNGSIFIRVLSYILLVSSLLSPALLVIGEVGVIDVIISLSMLLLFIYVLVKYGLRIYKIGILNYSQDKMWTKILKASKVR